MVEVNKFQPIETKPLYNDNIGKVTLYDASHANESEEQRIWTVTTIASLAYGNESAKNPEALYERMQSIKHESLWEFIRYGEYSTCYYNKYDRTKIDSSMRSFLKGEKQAWFTSSSYEAHQSSIACFRIKVPMFIRTQFMRHRSFSYLEMSRRYTKDSKQPFEFWFPNDFPYNKHEWIDQWQHDYADLCIAGKHTQVASRFFPQTTYTEFYMMGEVEGLTNFFKLRLDEHAQAEIRELAEGMLSLLEAHQKELYNKVKGKE